ncbi:MAG: biopolymer transporter ExbD [Deltaproteobacteria bacterium]|nr:biopolymer transporter ExbD [Deltaproteobacteria bacterium]
MQFQKEAEEEIGISLTSLIDVIFLLLIFFMVTTTIIEPSRRLDLQLPEAKAASSETKSVPVTIEMGQRGEISLNGEKVDLRTLEARLVGLGAGGKKTAMVRADRRLDYGRVVEVLGICRASGLHDIAIAVR